MYLHVNQVHDLKTLRFLFHLLLLGRRSIRLFCFDAAAILECILGLNEGVQMRAWFKAKQSPHRTKADAMKKSDLQVTSRRLLQQVQDHQCR